MSGRAHSFLSPKCDVHPIPNRGGHTVVAREAIAKGELIVVWSGTLVTGEELNGMPPTVRRYSLQVEENQYLVSLSDYEPPDYVNHSCDPNAGLSGQITLVAMRDIRPSEEITYDYAMSDGSPYDEFTCSCGSPHCRVESLFVLNVIESLQQYVMPSCGCQINCVEPITSFTSNG